MQKTLLLVFIHGFKGGDDTFGSFPAHLRGITSHALPNINVVAATYPKFETRGDLHECVGRFREWLQNVVIDLEVANQAPSPTVDPSVHVMLIGHSMGGIVGAEMLRLLASEEPLPSPNLTSSKESASLFQDEDAQKQQHPQQQKQDESKDYGAKIADNAFMFPHIQGLLAFDTPFLGISPGTVSYTAENHYKTASAAYDAITEVASVFGWGVKKENSATTNSKPQRLLPAATSTSTTTTTTNPTNKRKLSSSTDDAAATPSWQRWGRYAMFAGAAGAVAAGGAAALYTQRDRFSAGWTWSTSHLEFIGCLARPEELRRRLAALAHLRRERALGCANFYTRLGRGAVAVPADVVTSGMNSCSNPFSITRHIVRSRIRTFCNLPQDVGENGNNANGNGNGNDNAKACAPNQGLEWIEAVNEKAADETKAHMSMFLPAENPGFYDMAHQARDLLLRWLDQGWYSTASGRSAASEGKAKVFVDSDDVVIV